MDSRTRILNAAVRVFAEKGLHGARMDDIGAKAGINKAMVYYYYSDKENLFQSVLNMIIGQIYADIIQGMADVDVHKGDPVHILEQFVRLHFTAFSRNKEWSRLFLDVLSNRPESLRKAFLYAFETENVREQKLVFQAFERGIREGIFRDIDFMQLFISIIGMNIIYFLARPIAEFILDVNIRDEQAFLKEREESIVDLLLRGVLK